ncbi:MAG: N-acetyltransferase [Calditrichaeota bacterium]|nr:MAG: N-acetyltransferase [Calditrichota bacterium]
MKNYKIDKNVTKEEVGLIDQKIEEFNFSKTGIDDSKPLNLALRDENGNLVGGLVGMTCYGWFYISFLWVEEKLRGGKLGQKVLLEAEKEAKERGCKNSCLTTFTFQAQAFYEKNGYKIFGELEDYPENESLFFMRKKL